MIGGVFDFKDRGEGDGSCFKMQVKLNYDHNYEMTSCDAWNSSKCIKIQNRDILNSQEPLQECALEFNEGCSTEEGEECHDVPSLKCSVESSEHCSNVEREVCHDEMTQECATEYSEECWTEMKEECFESSGHECSTETSEQYSTEYLVNDFS